MMVAKWRALFPLALAVTALVGMAALLQQASPPARSAPATLCVAPGGTGCDPTACNGTCYASVQAAVDAALSNDAIHVAGGTYTGIHARGGMTQVVYISKTVILQGGFSPDLTQWDADAYATTLDAEGQGRVISIVGDDVGAKIQNFIITGGDATGITLNCPNFGGTSEGCGGGIFVHAAHPIISHNIITHNVAGVSTGPNAVDGGGLCLSYARDTIITDNLIISNTASLGARGAGGGMALSYPYDVVVTANQVLSNVATTHATLAGWGGGIAIMGSGAAATLEGNLIQGNRTNGSGGGFGAGLYLWYGRSSITSNCIASNTGRDAVYLGGYEARFEGNQVLDNVTHTGVAVANGGGIHPVLANNVIARSHNASSAALTFSAGASVPLTATLLHNTVIGPGAGTGIAPVSDYVTIAMTNTLIADTAWAITNTHPISSTVLPAYTLFWANDHDGIPGAFPIYGDPDLVDLGDGAYHLGPHSAAIDAGTITTVSLDIDGDARPQGLAPDIGADEAHWLHIYLALVLRAY